MDGLLEKIRACTHCEKHLPHGTRPVVQAHPNARILVAGQAPGRKVHETGIPFDDASGDRLRAWMGIDRETFYNPQNIAILPMGFCYPGTRKSGDLPPRPECAPLWRQRLLNELPHIELTLVIGTYALDWHMPDSKGRTLTDVVKNWKNHASEGIIPLPHPSPRNNIWLSKNLWFERDVLPELRNHIHQLTS